VLTYLILLFTIIPALELYILLSVGSAIGAGNTFLIIILTGVLGAGMARYQGFNVFENIQRELAQGFMPGAQLMDGLMILAAGILLLTPGFITDTFGFLLLIPPCRSLIKAVLQKKFKAMIRDGQTINFRSDARSHNGYHDIDI